MTTPTHSDAVIGESSPMSPERWRAVDAILQEALACEPERRVAFVADACGDDAEMRREVASLLAAHVDAGDDFLERPAAESIGAPALTAQFAAAIADRYVIEREIARGGMATVYLARDVKHDRHVAIKVLREELTAAVGAERFLAEIRVTASLQHPHILPLFDSGSTDGLLWYVMPYVDGETLRTRLLREGTLPVVDAIRIAREIADALDHAHARGIVHRDVKPENVLLQAGHALVADFGIALALEQSGGERITRTGLALGTPQYMAPEQAAGERALDSRVDVYALGAVLHEMIAGEPPFAAPTRQGVIVRLMHETPPALTARRPDVPQFVAAATQRALAKRPHDRFRSAAAFSAVLAAPLNAASASPHSAAADTAAVQPERGRTVSARAAMYLAIATLVVGIAGGLLIDRANLFERWRSNESTAPSGAPGRLSAPGRQPPMVTGLSAPLSIVDRNGQVVREIPSDRPWTPRFSPDGRFLAYGAFGSGRNSSDLWIMDVADGTTRRLTDDDADANDPQWSADGKAIAYSMSADEGKDVAMISLNASSSRVVAARSGTQFPSDWLRDGSAMLVTEAVGAGYDIIVQPSDGSPATPYAVTNANETAARISADGKWVAYTSDESGRLEVYLDSYPRRGQRTRVSAGGGAHPTWRADGRELYYWRDGALIAVQLADAKGGTPPAQTGQSVLFRASYEVGINTMYDVSPDGQRFAIVRKQ